MKALFQHVGNVKVADTITQSIEKIKEGLQGHTDKVDRCTALHATIELPKGDRSFESWSQRAMLQN